MCGLVMSRSRPSPPASSSSGSPYASGRLASSSRTVTPAWGGATRSLCFDLDQRELAVPAVQHADRGALDVAENHQSVAVDVDRARRVGDRHLPDRLPGGTQDPRHPDPLAGRPGGLDQRLARLAEQRGSLHPSAFAIGELALHPLRLLRELVNRLANRGFPAFGVADAVEELLPARVQRDVGAKAVLLARQHRLGGDRAMVQHPLQFRQLRGYEATEGGSDVDVAASQFESHTLNSQTWHSTLSLQPACRSLTADR